MGHSKRELHHFDVCKLRLCTIYNRKNVYRSFGKTNAQFLWRGMEFFLRKERTVSIWILPEGYDVTRRRNWNWNTIFPCFPASFHLSFLSFALFIFSLSTNVTSGFKNNLSYYPSGCCERKQVIIKSQKWTG